MTYPYPIKNWLNNHEYPSSGDELTMDEWAWEFIRRNAGYQKHWDIFKCLPDSSPDTGIKNGKWKGMPRKGQNLDNFAGYIHPDPLPGETLQEAFKTVAINREIKTDFPWCSIFTPYPGTELTEAARKEGLLDKRFTVDTIPALYLSKSLLKQDNIKRPIIPMSLSLRSIRQVRIPLSAVFILETASTGSRNMKLPYSNTRR